jgi:hypothetical protein
MSLQLSVMQPSSSKPFELFYLLQMNNSQQLELFTSPLFVSSIITNLRGC